jgi:hypothetical protein
MGMGVRRSTHVVVALVVALVALACTPDGDETGDGRSPATEAGRQQPVEPRWTQVALPPEAMLSEARVAFDGGVLARNDETLLPHMVSGVVAEPGEPNQVRVWTSEDTSEWETTDVSVHDGADASLAASVTNGRATALVGSTWTADGGVRPFVLSSQDRTSWQDVAPPEQAVERGIDPHEAVMNADGAVIVVGADRDNRPVAMRVSRDGGGEVVDLPAPEGDVELDDFAGLAVDDDVAVALAEVAQAGAATHPVAYRSTDGGQTWQLRDAPAGDGAGIGGVVGIDDGFVATGWVTAGDGSRDPAAWFSSDGRRWTAEEVPGTERDDDQWLGAPAALGNQVVANHRNYLPPVGLVMRRNGSGRWSLHVPAEPKDWIDGIGAGSSAAAPLADGGVLVARWARNSGIIGVVSGEPDGPCARTCSWTTALDTIGPDDPGLEWDWVAIEREAPVLLGFTTTMTVNRINRRRVNWTQIAVPSRFTFTDEATISEAEWDPPESADLSGLAVVSDDSGGVLVVGTRFVPSEPGSDPDRASDEMDLVGWFQAEPRAAWTPANGLAGPRTEELVDVAWFGDRWVAVGNDQDSSNINAHQHVGVWTSRDGVQWRSEEGPFEVSPDRDSSPSAACELPNGGALVVGEAESEPGGDPIPMAWRQTGAEWARIGGPALGEGTGRISSCDTRDDMTVLHGEFEGDSTVWRTADGETFERTTLGEPGDSIAHVRSLGSGFAAAGTRNVGSAVGATVWLSPDGEHWQAVPVPSDRRLDGQDVLDWEGRLVVTATGDSGPQVWILENAGELLSTGGAS